MTRVTTCVMMRVMVSVMMRVTTCIITRVMTLHQIYFLDEIISSHKKLIGWLHIAEFILIIICVATITLRYTILFKTAQIKILHINMKVIFHHTIIVLYIHLSFRFVQFVFAFTGSFQGCLFYLVLK